MRRSTHTCRIRWSSTAAAQTIELPTARSSAISSGMSSTNGHHPAWIQSEDLPCRRPRLLLKRLVRIPVFGGRFGPSRRDIIDVDHRGEGDAAEQFIWVRQEPSRAEVLGMRLTGPEYQRKDLPRPKIG